MGVALIMYGLAPAGRLLANPARGIAGMLVVSLGDAADRYRYILLSGPVVGVVCGLIGATSQLDRDLSAQPSS